MNDRFKYRIWHEGKMHYNDFIVTATGYTAKLYQENDYMMKFNQEDLECDKQCVVMQCTGLKDKNGKLIYENDIVADVLTNKFTINFDEKYLSFLLTNIKTKESMVFYPNIKLEIIGNIYENPELLEVEDDSE